MGIVQRQGLRNTFISYVGLGIGFVNTTLVLPRLLAPAQLGLTSVLVSLATMGALVSALGFTNTTLRYFPYFRNRENGHSGFLPLLLGLPLALFGVVALVLWLGRPLVLRWYAHDAALLGPHYGVMLGLALCILLYNLLEAYTKSLFHTSFSSFLTDVLQRLLIVGAAVLYGSGYLSFDGFVLAYMGSYAAIAALLLGYLAVIGELHLRPTRAVLRVRPVGELLRFGSFALLGNISGTLLVTIDSLMLGSHSFADAGIYTIALNISTALAVPFRALLKTAYPLIAEYWKEGASEKLLDFYRRTTRLNTALGAYLALGIGLNLPFIYSLIHRPEYAAGTVAVLLLLAGRLTDGITGINGIIVVTSPRYRYDLLFNLALSVLIIGLNALLIPRLGLLGAAISNAAALAGINLARTWFVWRSFGWQPFDRRIFYILGLAGGAALVAWLLPTLPNSWLTLLLRGGVLTVLYGAGLLLSGWVPEVSALARRLGIGR
ncbi:polysaccharide biosynthesis C-terminal domain-containing protein [Hymenobacter sp. BRD128]|uniref:lipopolysaccharide biosynthesis protein n=1 Tax=Hymenobacter sp. BRD128 TaxID=2675878 RepID=UPI001564022C|nr:polysaccharide biosynthesis C-terminal domain-containing protein [Hymenobacter sp. BRD128]QKG56761.1 polysaccharide biosynthesis C-terminal domain-containing protein [Hymenobacter sp. BRD128]